MDEEENVEVKNQVYSTEQIEFRKKQKVTTEKGITLYTMEAGLERFKKFLFQF